MVPPDPAPIARVYGSARSTAEAAATAVRLAAEGALVGVNQKPTGDPTARAVMADLFADFPGPVLIGFPSGHTAGAAMTLPLGVNARVVAGTQPRLVIEEAAVD